MATPDELITRYDEVGWQVRKVAEEVLGEPKLASAAEVVAPLAPRRPLRVARPIADAADRAAGAGAAARDRRVRRASCPSRRAADPGADHQRHAHRRAARRARDAGLRRGRGPQGRRVRGHQGPAGPVRRRPGLRHPARRDLDPRAGARAPGWPGCCPIPEIQYLAYLHNAEDQLRGEAATHAVLLRAGRTATRWWCGWPGWPTRRASAGTSTTTTRWPCCATSPGWCSPCRPGPTTPRRCCGTCLAAAAVDGSVCVFLEPIALYHTRDLYAAGRRRVAGAVRGARPSGAASHVPIGRARVYPVGSARRPDHHHVRQRPADVAAGRRPAGRRGRTAPAWWTCAGWPRCRSPTSIREAVGHRPGAGRRRDPPLRRGRRGRPRRPGGRRLRRRGPAGRVGGLVRSARSGGPARAGRGRCHHTGCPRPAGTVNCRHDSVRHLRTAAASVWTTRYRQVPDTAPRASDEEARDSERDRWSGRTAYAAWRTGSASSRAWWSWRWGTTTTSTTISVTP